MSSHDIVEMEERCDCCASYVYKMCTCWVGDGCIQEIDACQLFRHHLRLCCDQLILALMALISLSLPPTFTHTAACFHNWQRGCCSKKQPKSITGTAHELEWTFVNKPKLNVGDTNTMS